MTRMTVEERTRAMEPVLAMAKRAATLIARIYEGPFEVSYKSKNDPVTNADKEANALLCASLASEFPGIPIVAEESEPAAYVGYEHAETAWFVDPIARTREFVAKNGEFAVMIGLAEDGRATLGVIVHPVDGRAFVGGEGIDAFEEDAMGVRTPIHVSSVSSLLDAELVVSRSHPRRESLGAVAAQRGVRKITACGSAGVKATRIATGQADVYSQPGRVGKLWDACAPEALVVAAGGRVADARGNPFDYRSPDLDNKHGFVATNPALYPQVLELLRKLERERGTPR
jgi:3'(2'), 5'-bisphosphate nucleotidase